jgi:endonuclease YncB( thermonuclease family)
MSRIQKWTAVFMLLAGMIPPHLAAAPSVLLQGRVMQISDGDSLTVKDPRGKIQRIRLLGVDAPEKNQTFGSQAAQQLKRWLNGKTVKAHCHDKDRYGRRVCQVFVNEQDVGLSLLESGHAWFYRRYSKSLESADARAYEMAEQKARKARLGLWKDPKAISPWLWRKENATR